MVAENLLRDVLALPVEDREELYERLRRSLEEDPAAMPLTPEQEEELDRRYQASLANPEAGYTLEEVEAMLEARRK